MELPTSDFLRYLAPVLTLLGLYDVPNTWHLRAFRAASDLAGTPLELPVAGLLADKYIAARAGLIRMCQSRI